MDINIVRQIEERQRVASKVTIPERNLNMLVRHDVPLLLEEIKKLHNEVEVAKSGEHIQEVVDGKFNKKHLVSLIKKAKVGVIACMMYCRATNNDGPERVVWRLEHGLKTLDEAEQKVEG